MVTSALNAALPGSEPAEHGEIGAPCGITEEASRSLPFIAEPPKNWLVSSAAQARRDRLRIALAQDKIAGLQAQVAALARENARPVRNLVQVVWQRVRGHAVLPATFPVPDRDRKTRARALVIDHYWPEPDRDSGSIDLVNLLQTLLDLGLEVRLAASEALQGDTARDRLEALGIGCIDPQVEGPLAEYLVRHGSAFDLCVLCRVYCGGSFLEAVQRDCGNARIIFNTVDLNFVREERRAKLHGDQKLLELLPQLRAREEHIIRESDATILVSDAELQLVEETIPEAVCLQMPLSRPIQPPVTPFFERRGIGFIGNFSHQPNLDAIRHFLHDIWPLVRRSLPDCELSIVGENLPAAVLADCPGSVNYLGHVPNIAPWFESLRLTIAPLRFGAGAKGKVASSMAAGVPAVISAIAAEGMALDRGAGVLVATGASDFAACICRIHDDPVLWSRLSEDALRYAYRSLSLDAWRARLDHILFRLGL